ncbi:PDDEXK nuclease domain-containing protein [Burkholderia ambifaria]|uniref:PDDEXK nuclease domain-containing protein n=1 Tax=Burkholderia ambifaria TaxID=152480 RepID=UPI0039F55B1A
MTLLDKLEHAPQRLWYAEKSPQHGRPRSVLPMQIETAAHAHAGNAVTNFADRLPPPQSDLARDALKEPYVFDFLGLTENARERDIKRALTQYITRFLLELGAGFAFVARQYRLEVGGDEFFIALLFYHLKLRCYVVVELKTTPFKPQYARRLICYLSKLTRASLQKCRAPDCPMAPDEGGSSPPFSPSFCGPRCSGMA